MFQNIGGTETKITGENIHKKILWTETQPRSGKLWHTRVFTTKCLELWDKKAVDFTKSSIWDKIVVHLTIFLALWDKLRFSSQFFRHYETKLKFLSPNFWHWKQICVSCDKIFDALRQSCDLRQTDFSNFLVLWRNYVFQKCEFLPSWS